MNNIYVASNGEIQISKNQETIVKSCINTCVKFDKFDHKKINFDITVNGQNFYTKKYDKKL